MSALASWQAANAATHAAIHAVPNYTVWDAVWAAARDELTAASDAAFWDVTRAAAWDVTRAAAWKAIRGAANAAADAVWAEYAKELERRAIAAMGQEITS